jgi:hypothetical protein
MLRTLNIAAGSLAVCTITALLGAIALNTPAHAQTAGEVDPLEDFQTNDGGSDIFGSNGADSTGVFNLIHNLMLNNGTPLDQFNRQRSENITTEAESFREAQMQRIQLQESSPAIEIEPDILPAE